MRRQKWLTMPLSLVVLATLAGLPMSGCTLKKATPELNATLHQDLKMDEESKAFVDKAVPAITQNWNVDELIQRSNAKMLQSTPPDELKRLFKLYARKIGPLQDYDGSTGQADHLDKPGGKVYIANYKAGGYYDKGHADIKLILHWENNQWKIQFFQVTSDALYMN